MDFKHPYEHKRRSPDGVRRVDHLETGVRNFSERILGFGGFGVHDPIGEGGHTLHPLRARLILTFIIFNTGATAAIAFIAITRAR